MSKHVVSCFVFLFLSCFPVRVSGADGPAQVDPDIAAARALIHRIIPAERAKDVSFVLEKIPAKDGRDTFELEGKGHSVVIRGNNAQALCRGFNWYLNKYCRTSVSWFKSEPVQLPATLPTVTGKVQRTCRHKRRFFLNYCTFGYTLPWWKWNDWERFIDWMALNGVNMPLACTGQEAIWQKVWRNHGMTDEQIRAYFTGPGHLPWHRMGNCDRWLGPLPQSYIDNQLALQKRILKRQRSLGMTPVLPAFAGHVPKEIKAKYPNANITSLGSYSLPEENSAYFLNPTDPLFLEIQEEFLREQTKQFGTDHIYGADPFNEMTPPSWEPEYLATVAKAIYKGMSNVDPDAEWVQMGWMFYFLRKNWTNERIAALVNSIPEGKMTILDYYCEMTEVWRQTEAFGGAPYIWCSLENFGGNTEIVGNMKLVADRLLAAENDPKRGKLIGIGSTLEGFGVTRMYMEWLFELAWDKDAADVGSWIEHYADTRSGTPQPVVEAGWGKLRKALYDKKISYCGDGNILSSRPQLTGSAGYAYLCDRFADIPLLCEGLSDLLKASPESLQLDRYQYDLVNFTRQLIDFTGHRLRDEMTFAYYRNDKAAFEKAAARFLEAHDDLERLLRTRPEFLLGNWTNAARSFGADEAESDRYEVSARVLLTTWGQEGSPLTDYAHRDRAGLVHDYYKKRWEIFIDALRGTIGADKSVDLDAFHKKIAAMEWKWAHSHNPYSSETHGDPLAVVRELAPKYTAIQSEKKLRTKTIANWKFDASANPKLSQMTFDVSSDISRNGGYLVQTKYDGKDQARRIASVVLISPKGETPLKGKDDFHVLDITDYPKPQPGETPRYQLRVTFAPGTDGNVHQAAGQLILFERH